MGKFFLSLLLTIFSLFSYSQNLNYVGKFDGSLSSKMSASDLLMYTKCISAIGKDYEPIDWASEDICEIVKKEPNHFKCEVVKISSEDDKVKISPRKGQTTLGAEKIILVFEKKNRKTSISLLVLY